MTGRIHRFDALDNFRDYGDYAAALPHIEQAQALQPEAPVFLANHGGALAEAASGEPTTVELSIPREVPSDFDPDPAYLVDLHPLEHGPSSAHPDRSSPRLGYGIARTVKGFGFPGAGRRWP